MRAVVRETREGRLWNEFVARYHYLGYKTLVGAQMRYAVHDRNGWPLAMLGFSTAAWKLAPRDRFIGWSPEIREKNLPLVVDNPRFLILPWVEIPNLGSHILALVRRRLPIDWTERYNTTPRADRDLRRDPALHRRRLQGVGLDPCRNHSGAGGATTATSSTTNPARTSGSGPFDAIGSAHSIGKILSVVGPSDQSGGRLPRPDGTITIITGRANGYGHRRDYEESVMPVHNVG